MSDHDACSYEYQWNRILPFRLQHNLKIKSSFRSLLIYLQRSFFTVWQFIHHFILGLLSNSLYILFLQPRLRREAFRSLEVVAEVWWWGPGWRTSPLVSTQPYCPSPGERSSMCWSNSPGTAGCTDVQRAARGVTRSAGTVFVFEWMWKKSHIC